MLDRKLAGHALSLTWRFMLCFLAMVYPLYSYTISLIKVQPDGAVPSDVTSVFFVLSLQILIPFVIPFLAMYSALAWYGSRVNNEA